MTRNEYLSALREKLRGLPEAEIRKTVSFYGEMILDRMEDGMCEEEAVANMEAPSAIAHRLTGDVPPAGAAVNTAEPRQKSSKRHTALLIIGSPIWLALLITAFAVLISLFAALWAVVVSLFAAVFAIGISGFAAFLASFIYWSYNHLTSLGALGIGLLLMGLALLLWFPVNALSGRAARATRAAAHGIRKLFSGKERVK